LEHDADLYAILYVEGGGELQSRFSNAAFMIFQYLDFFRHCVGLAPGAVRKVLDTHPAPVQRLARLRDSLPESVGAAKNEIMDATKLTEFYKNAVSAFLKSKREDLLTFYGSVYLPSFKHKLGTDRIDF
jgi:hypothetical protein